MFAKYILPLCAAIGLGFAIYTVVQARQAPEPSRPLVPPPTRPKFNAIAGAGIIEARQENIPIGAPVPGVVCKVFVKVNQQVKGPTENSPGDPLFQIDDRVPKAELNSRLASLKAAEAELKKAQSLQSKDLQVARAMVEQARARFHNAEVIFQRSANLVERSAGTRSDYDRDRYAYEEARAALQKAEADLALKDVNWEQDIHVAEVAVLSVQSQVEAARASLEQLTVRALADGEILQVNVRPGQLATLTWNEPLIVVGNLDRLHVRVDIDEQDVPLFRPGAEAVATLKGRPQIRFDLDFVKVEPYVIPKRSLTGDNAERVDTRVLQVIYALPDERPFPFYVGQQMDVYLKAAEPPPGLSLEADPNAPKPFEDEPASVAKSGTPLPAGE